MRIRHVALLGAIALTAPAASQSVQFSAVVQEDVGYGTNPFLRAGVDKGAGLISLTVSPKLAYQTALSSTDLSGSYDRDKYTSKFGFADALNVALNRTDQLSPHLATAISAGYSTSNKATILDPSDPTSFDPLNFGRRTSRATGSYHVQWQATAADVVAFGANVSHLGYGGSRATVNGIASDYTQYAVDGSYNHVIDARTSAGLQASISTVHSRLYPQSRSIQPSVTIKRQLTAVWDLNGHIGLVFQDVAGPFGRSTTSLGYGVTICAAYPLTRFCASAERASAPSGYGGLRTSSSVSATLSRELSAQSRISLSANYNKSSSAQLLSTLATPSGRLLSVDAEYDRDLTQRLSWGFGGRYQWRDTSRIGTARAITGTLHLTAKIGRI